PDPKFESRPRRRGGEGGTRSALSASVAVASVEGEGAGAGVVRCPGALEAELDVAAGRDARVVADVGGCGGAAGLREGGVPGVGDLLVSGEGPLQRPAVDRGGAGVGDRHVRGETAGPLVLHVGDLTRPAGAAGSDRPGEGRRARRAEGVTRRRRDDEGSRGSRRSGDQAGGADRQSWRQAGGRVNERLSWRRIRCLEL